MDFICTHRCFWLSLIEEGQLVQVKDESEIPPSVRPFFETKEKVVAEKKEIVEAQMSELEEVRAELDKLGIPFDKRWSLVKLKNKLQLAKRDK